jgi:hypothetical protein
VARAPCQRAHPRHQLGDVKRLGEVVIGADTQPLNAVFDGGCRGEHQDGALAGGHYRPADLVAVNARQIPVEDDDVIAYEQ